MYENSVNHQKQTSCFYNILTAATITIIRDYVMIIPNYGSNQKYNGKQTQAAQESFPHIYRHDIPQ